MDEHGRMEDRLAEVWADVAQRDRDGLREQKARRDGGSSNQYGHDLHGAIQRGWANRARRLCSEAMDANGNRAGIPSPERRARFGFALTLASLIQAAAERGVTAEQIRDGVQDALNCTNSLSIKGIVKRYGPEEAA